MAQAVSSISVRHSVCLQNLHEPADGRRKPVPLPARKNAAWILSLQDMGHGSSVLLKDAADVGAPAAGLKREFGKRNVLAEKTEGLHSR